MKNCDSLMSLDGNFEKEEFSKRMVKIKYP